MKIGNAIPLADVEGKSDGPLFSPLLIARSREDCFINKTTMNVQSMLALEDDTNWECAREQLARKLRAGYS